MNTLLNVVLLCVFAVPVLAQGGVLTDFVTIAEGFTSPTRSGGIDIAHRKFSTPTFAKTCGESEQPSRLISPTGLVLLQVGEWFPLRRLIIVGVDRRGRVLRPLPFSLEVEDKKPPLLNLQSDMISDARVLPIRMGALVYVGHDCGSLCGGGGYHRLVKRLGQWQDDREYRGITCGWAS
jgi:hypothetical protein